MSLDAAIYSQLTGTAGIAAIVATRVYPAMLPQTETLPAITYIKVSTMALTTHDGPANLERCRYAIVSWATTPAAAQALADLVKLALSCNGFTAAGHTVQVSFIENEETIYDDGLESGRTRYGIGQDYMIWHNS